MKRLTALLIGIALSGQFAVPIVAATNQPQSGPPVVSKDPPPVVPEKSTKGMSKKEIQAYWQERREKIAESKAYWHKRNEQIAAVKAYWAKRHADIAAAKQQYAATHPKH